MKTKVIQCARCGVSIEINNKQGRKKYCDVCRNMQSLMPNAELEVIIICAPTVKKNFLPQITEKQNCA